MSTKEEVRTALANALERLDAGLREVDAVRNLLADSEFRDRKAARMALNACIGFIAISKEWRTGTGLTMLVVLEAALRDLDNGYVAPMLRARHDSKGRPRSRLNAFLHGQAAGIMGGLMKYADMSKDDAAKWVAKKLTTAGRAIAVEMVIDWRKNALNHKNLDMHRQYAAALDATGWDNPVVCAEYLTERLLTLFLQKGE